MFLNPEEPRISVDDQKLVEYILSHHYDQEGHESDQ
jgi:hypothetical protein